MEPDFKNRTSPLDSESEFEEIVGEARTARYANDPHTNAPPSSAINGRNIRDRFLSKGARLRYVLKSAALIIFGAYIIWGDRFSITPRGSTEPVVMHGVTVLLFGCAMFAWAANIVSYVLSSYDVRGNHSVYNEFEVWMVRLAWGLAFFACISFSGALRGY